MNIRAMSPPRPAFGSGRFLLFLPWTALILLLSVAVSARPAEHAAESKPSAALKAHEPPTAKAGHSQSGIAEAANHEPNVSPSAKLNPALPSPNHSSNTNSAWEGPIPEKTPDLGEFKPEPASNGKSEAEGGSPTIWDSISKETLSGAPQESHEESGELRAHSPVDSALTRNAALSSPFVLDPNNRKSDKSGAAYFKERIEEARKTRKSDRPEIAAKILAGVLTSPGVPEELQKTALLELAIAAQEAKQFVKAQQIFDHFRKRFPDDPSMAEVLLRQGLIYREMGANQMALVKFYAVNMTALNNKSGHLEYYKFLVLHASTAIAETKYLLNEFEEAAKFFKILLKQEAPGLNKERILYQLVLANSHMKKPDSDVIGTANEFIIKYPQSNYLPEVRFLLSVELKKRGRVRDSIQEVNRLLESQLPNEQKNPQAWRYWQQRTGNEIANQLFEEGDYANALELYLTLVPLDSTAEWQAPILYQIGLVYERMGAPNKAIDAYDKIIAKEKEIVNSGRAATKEVLEMARWRRGYFTWDSKAERIRNELINLKPQTAADRANP